VKLSWPLAAAAQATTSQGGGLVTDSTVASVADNRTSKLGPDSGSVVDNLYTSDYFGFSYEFPKGWSVQGEVTKKYIMEVEKAIVSGGDPTKKAVADVSEEHTHHLLMVSQYPFGTPVKFNSNIIVAAEDISYAPGIQKGSDYLELIKTSVARRHPELKVLNEPTDSTFGGRVFSHLDVSYENTTGKVIYQTSACTMDRGQALTFIFTSQDPEILKTLVDTLNTLEFKSEHAESRNPKDASPPFYLTVTFLSPTGGVDFSRYVEAMIGSIRRKWNAVMPDIALHGTKGRVSLIFDIKTDGTISGGPTTELSSGIGQLDEAAIAAIRISAPFGELPSEFKQSSIRFRMVFFYNTPSKSLPK
jgi:TonB family protein